MNADVRETAFISFVCPACHQEIEAPADMATQETECPTCAALIQVPAESEPGTPWGAPATPNSKMSKEQVDAMKSRTIRIELPDSW
jgi:DNA-directed RNA polymerase subunit RPC12/RpoP